MCVASVLKAERERVGMTQKQLGSKIRASVSTVRAYEQGTRRMPADVVRQAIRELKSPRLAFECCNGCECNVIVPPWLGAVDCHPLTQITSLAEEVDEVRDALKSLDLRNKRRPQDLSAQDRAALEFAIEQALDLVPSVIMAAVSWCEVYGMDFMGLRRRQLAKLDNRGYVGGEKAA